MLSLMPLFFFLLLYCTNLLKRTTPPLLNIAPMSILDSTYMFFSGTSVTEKNNVISVDGIRTPVLALDLQNKWKTNAVSNYFFKKLRRLSLEINAFFAPDFHYIIETLINDRRTRSNRNVLRQVSAQLKTNTWLDSAFSTDYAKRLNYKALDDLTTALLPHQWEFLKTYEERTARWRLNGYILGAAPGSGKTIMNIALAKCLESDVAIYVVPKNSVVSVWEDTLKWIFKDPEPYWISTSGEALDTNRRHYVVHYEQLELIVEFFRNNHKGRKITICLDESHNFNDIKSQRTNLFIELCRITKSENVIWASGTPLKAMGSEVIPILRTIDPYFKAEEEDRFKRIFGLSTARALDILAHRLGYMTFKVDKAKTVGNTVMHYRVDVKLKDSKPYTLAYIKDEMANFVRERLAHYQKNMDRYIADYRAGLKHYESTIRTVQEKQEFLEYQRMANSMHRGFDPFVHKTEPQLCNAFEKKYIIPTLPKDIKDAFIDARSVYKYVDLKVRGEALGRVLGRKRTECNLAMLEEWKNYRVTDLNGEPGEKPEVYDSSLPEIISNSTNKTILFTSYVEVVDRVAEITTSLGFKPLKVYGETNNELPRIVADFGRKKELNPLAATLKSLSTAVPLVMANTVIFLNAPFRIHEYEQACSRVDRLGQTETVHIFDVFLDTGEEPNISTRSLDIMAWSKEMIDAMMGNKSGSDAIALEGYTDIEGLDELCLEELREDLTGIVRAAKEELMDAGCSSYAW